MRKNVVFVALAAIAFASCNGGFKQGEGGMLYNIHSEKGKPKIKEGDFISANLVVKNDADSVLSNSYDAGQQQPLVVPKPQFKGDVIDALALLGEGDSATVKVSVDSIFKKATRPPGFKGKYIIYDIKIEKVIPKGKMTDQEFQTTVGAYIQAQAKIQQDKEPAKIQKFIADSKQNFTKADSGFYYNVTKAGNGPLVAKGDTVVANYVGKFTSGKLFDTNIKAEALKGKLQGAEQRPYEPLKFAVGERRVILGWDLAFPLLNKGSKATLIIPSNLAYGSQGNPVIAPYTPLVFEVEVTDIIKPGAKPAAPVAKK